MYVKLRKRVLVLCLSLGTVWAWGSPAEAQFYRSLLRGLSRASAPAAPSGQRFGQFRISPVPGTDGWRLDMNRSFGPDAFGRPNRIDLGLYSLTLNNGQIVTQAEFSRGILPQVSFFSNTPEAIDYSVSLNTGFQDFEINNAQLAWTTQWNVNALGFYDYQLSVSHRGEYELDGFTLVDTGTLDFDIGPINLSGNVIADALALVTQPFFDSTGATNPFAAFSGRATKRIEVARTVDEILSRVEAGDVLTEADMDELIEATVIAAALDQTLPDFSFLSRESFASTLDAINGSIPGNDVVSVGNTGTVSSGLPQMMMIPEPATSMLMMMTAGMLILWRRRS